MTQFLVQNSNIHCNCFNVLINQPFNGQNLPVDGFIHIILVSSIPYNTVLLYTVLSFSACGGRKLPGNNIERFNAIPAREYRRIIPIFYLMPSPSNLGQVTNSSKKKKRKKFTVKKIHIKVSVDEIFFAVTMACRLQV